MTVVYDMASIKTEYRGRIYRSRLEARWAAMFDRFHWKYEYEPFDLNGWFPDFVLKAFNSRKRILVEIKPITEFDREVAAQIDKACPYYSDDPQEEILLLGAMVDKADETWNDGFPDTRIGWLRDETCGWGEAILVRSNSDMHNPVGFYHANGSWMDRITGIYDGDGHIGLVDFEDVLHIWQEAGNAVQYQARRQRV